MPSIQKAPVVEGDALRILGLLKEYKIELPIDFIANTLGKSETAIEGTLSQLDDRGVIQIEGPMISIRR
jgi:hypothetical protein